MPLLHTTIPGRPVPWSRTGSSRGKRYTPKKQRRWQQDAGYLFRARWPQSEPHDGPVRLEVDAVWPLPKASKRYRTRTPRPCRPDADNVAKIVADALEQAGVIDNDRQIVELVARKHYGAAGEDPCVEVLLERYRLEV